MECVEEGADVSAHIECVEEGADVSAHMECGVLLTLCPPTWSVGSLV